MSDSSSSTQIESLEARLRRLDDMEEIHRLFLDYGRFLDGKDFRSCSRLFAEEGEFILPFESAVGPDAIHKSMEAMRGIHLAADPGVDFHVLANPVVHLDGDTATAHSMWLYVSAAEDGHPQLAQFGHYEDVLTRENGRWHFKSRDAARDIGVPQHGVPGATRE